MGFLDASVSLFDRLFAVTIAFFLPGMVTLFGIATVNGTVQKWLEGAQSGPTLVGLLFVLLAALALNVVITALRWFLFEHVHLKIWRGCPLVPGPPKFDLAKRKELEDQYTDLKHQHYYHYLAYGNMAVALPLAVAVWKVGTNNPEPHRDIFWFAVGAAAVVSFVLALAACDAINRFDRKAEVLLGLVPDTPRPPVISSAGAGAGKVA